MNYEQRYKEALEMARQLCTYPTTQPFISDLQDLFPELKESEDEQIRKWLIGYFQQYKSDGVVKFANGLEIDSIIAWLEKQDNNADKVEPKFNVGDWIISHYNHVAHIKAIDEKNYFLSCDNGSCERLSIEYIDRNWRLWTITDAKDGDVLVYGDNPNHNHVEVIMLFKSVRNERSAFTHFHIFIDQFRIDDWCDCGKNVHPATKEQRELLFRKMKEAGYEWDAEKKESKKIEQTTEIPFGAKDSELQEATYYIPDGYHAEINGNEVVIKKSKQNTTWKPTEEQIEALEHLLETIRRHEYSYFHEEKFISLHSLLEQLKEL